MPDRRLIFVGYSTRKDFPEKVTAKPKDWFNCVSLRLFISLKQPAVNASNSTIKLPSTKTTFTVAALSLLLYACNIEEKPDSSSGGQYRLAAAHSSKYLTLSYHRPLRIISDSVNADCVWRLKRFPDGSVQFISLPSGEAVELSSVKSDVVPYTAAANDDNIRQRFRLVYEKSRDGNRKAWIQSAYNDLCLDVAAGDTADFAPIVTWHKRESNNQLWLLQGTDDKLSLVTAINGKKLSVAPNTHTAGADIGQWTFADRKEQIWIIRKSGDFYTLQNAYSGLYLHESGGQLSFEHNVLQHPSATEKGSLWMLDLSADSITKIKNAASGLCLDVKDNAYYDGAIVITFNCSEGSRNQWWKPEEVIAK